MADRSGAPALALRARDRTLALGGRPWVMGVVNATPDSFSDSAEEATPEARLERLRRLIADGVDVIDIGGESGVTDRAPVDPGEEIDRVSGLIEVAAGELGALVSVDTYKPEVARAAIAAGAAIVNDVSGLAHTEMAAVCAETGAALVIMHTRAAPKQRLQDPGLYEDVFEDVLEFLTERIELALSTGMRREQLIVDPGPDFTKTPAQTLEVLRRLEQLHTLGLPVLLAVSRKDFVGAITGRPPRGRLAGTLAAVSHGVDAGAHILRVHDVPETIDFLAVRAALRGESDLDPQLRLADELRWERPRQP
jgi:dihydropteroate synthase